MNQRMRLPVLITLILVLLLSQACAKGQNQSADIGPLKVGYLPVSGYAPIYIAIERGYFAEQGLEVELLPFDSGAKMIVPLSTGQLDVGSGESGTALFNAMDKGLDIKVVAGTAAMNPGYGSVPFLLRKDLFDSGEVTEPADLRGRKIAANVLRGYSEYLVSEVLAKGGLTVDDVELVALPFPDMPAAFANKAVDAAIIAYPSAGKAIKDGSAIVLVEGDKIADSPQNTVVYFGKRLLDPANHEIAVRFLVAYLKSLRDLLGEKWGTDETLAIISKYTNLPPELLKSDVKPYYEPNGKINLESVEAYQEYYISRGYTEYTEPIPISEFVDYTLLEEALKRAGEVKP